MQTHRKEQTTKGMLRTVSEKYHDFLFNIVMGNETWVHLYNPEEKQQSIWNTGILVHHNKTIQNIILCNKIL